MATWRGNGEMETGREVMGRGGRGKRWGWGGRGWRGGDIEGTKVGWLMLFYNTWSQLIYSVSCIMGRWEGERGGDGEAGVGEGETGRGAKVGWLMLFNDTWSQ